MPDLPAFERRSLEAEFDRFADEYRRSHASSIRVSGETPDFFARYKIDDVKAALERAAKAPRRILDFGGGIGNSLGPMASAFPESEVVLLDPSARSLEIAEGRFPGMARFQHFDGETIPFAEGSFDLVFTACVFHHIPEALHRRLLGEIGRVLSPRGDFFLFEHNPWNPLTLHAVRNCAFDRDAVLIAAPEMRRRMRAAGLATRAPVFRIFFPRALAALRPLEQQLGAVPMGAQYFVQAGKGAA